jgi:hypothetical protein
MTASLFRRGDLIATQVFHNLPADACSLLGVILFIKVVGFLREQNQSYNEESNDCCEQVSSKTLDSRRGGGGVAR